ncbi:type II toxin-antitoxin system HicA family toxin [Candidatus Curtissbacteria bacterium]|nr:type II toxin-antitoxin system HicA family toxin [Candidatus Curtissbacteria bacterium]
MSGLPQVRPKELVRALEKAGFNKGRQTGSHVFLKHQDGRLTSVSIHPKPIPTGTLRAILRQTKIKTEDLKKLLR